MLRLRTKPHDIFDAGAVIPTAIEDHDLACGRKMRHVTLHIHLSAFAVGRCGKSHDSKHARTDPLGDCLDRPSLAGAITALEYHDDTQSFSFHPVLKQAKLCLQPA